MRIYFFLSIIAVLFFAHTAFAQKGKTPTPSPTPVIINWEFSVMETVGNENRRTFRFEMELGKKSDSKKLRSELEDVGFKIEKLNPNGISVSYPLTVTDCEVLQDAEKAANIAVKYIGKNYATQFGIANTKIEFYQSMPRCGGGKPSAARPSMLRSLLI